MSWTDDLVTNGYTLFPAMTPSASVQSALDAIQNDLSVNYDPGRQVEYDNLSYCPDIVGSPAIMELLLKSPIYPILEGLFGIKKVWISDGQIAIRRAHNQPMAISPTPHLDGFSTGLNAVPEGNIYNHTVLVGVFLTPVREQFAGNFTVWPGSHYIYERYFRQRGPRALHEPAPNLDLGEPIQLMCEVGDVVLAHYQLGHTPAVNTTDGDRIAVFFRAVLRRVKRNRWHYLTNIWEGWNLLTPAILP
jgi:hypothetical protein